MPLISRRISLIHWESFNKLFALGLRRPGNGVPNNLNGWNSISLEIWWLCAVAILHNDRSASVSASASVVNDTVHCMRILFVNISTHWQIRFDHVFDVYKTLQLIYLSGYAMFASNLPANMCSHVCCDIIPRIECSRSANINSNSINIVLGDGTFHGHIIWLMREMVE